MVQVKTILSPTDFSPSSAHALQLARSLARDYQAKLVHLHVAPLPVGVHPGMETVPLPALTKQQKEEIHEQLRQLHPADAGIAVETRVEEGEPAAEILGVANDLQCDLIVMGTHGRTGLGRLLMGSVAEQVIRLARCPVLTVKVPAAQS